MAGNRKRRYTCQEALSFFMGKIETLESSNANVPSVNETDADTQSLGEQIDEDE